MPAERQADNMELYKIRETIKAMFDLADETGEISDETFTALGDLKLAEEEKLESIGLLIKNWTADREAIMNEEAALKMRKEILARKIDRLKKYVVTHMLETKQSKFESPKVVLSLRESRAIEIVDETLIPDAYCEYDTVKKISKRAIADAIKSGNEVAGAVIRINSNLQVG